MSFSNIVDRAVLLRFPKDTESLKERELRLKKQIEMVMKKFPGVTIFSIITSPDEKGLETGKLLAKSFKGKKVYIKEIRTTRMLRSNSQKLTGERMHNFKKDQSIHFFIGHGTEIHEYLGVKIPKGYMVFKDENTGSIIMY